MTESARERIAAFYAETYDEAVPDWPGELDFYHTLAAEARAQGGAVLERWQSEPVRLHCVFRFEMEHLLGRTGFAVDALYGDFFRQPLCDDSSEMIWVARPA
jgi:hypothetical protein